MSKQQPAPPPPQVQYEGYRWLGSRWGRSGRTAPALFGAIFFLAVATLSFVQAIVALGDDNSRLAIGSTLVGVLSALAGAFYLVELHYSKRAMAEQEPVETAIEATAIGGADTGE